LGEALEASRAGNASIDATAVAVCLEDEACAVRRVDRACAEVTGLVLEGGLVTAIRVHGPQAGPGATVGAAKKGLAVK
jgi:hypothetical protein